MNIYVANISWDASEDDLEQFFNRYGNVTSVKIIKDRETNKSRGFGFVDLEGDGSTAIAELDGKDFLGRPLKVNEARPKAEHS